MIWIGCLYWHENIADKFWVDGLIWNINRLWSSQQYIQFYFVYLYIDLLDVMILSIEEFRIFIFRIIRNEENYIC